MFLINANLSRHSRNKSLILSIITKHPKTPSFSTSSRSFLAARRSPTVRSAQRRQQHEPRQQQQSDHSNSLPLNPSLISAPRSTEWPTKVLNEAAISGELSISAQAAEAVLDDFVAKSSTDSGKNLCIKHGIQPLDLTRLAKLLLYYGGSVHTKLGFDLLHTASRLKDPSGTLIIYEMALKAGTYRDIPSAYREHLQQMMSKNNYAAMYMQGKIYEAEKQNSLALGMYLKSLKSASEGYAGAEAFEITLGEFWTSIYRSKAQNDPEGALTAIKRAALEYDEPSAYYLLAKEYTPEYSKEYEQYMLKAAASGKMRAADALGKYYFKQFQGNLSSASEKHINDKGGDPAEKSEDSSNIPEASPGPWPQTGKVPELAREWFNVGAEANIPSSQIYLAVILRQEGKLREGLDWLEKASGSNSWAKTVSWLQKFWESDAVDFMRINLESLRLRLDKVV